MSEDHPETVVVQLSDAPERRLDKALASALPEELALSRSRVTSLIQSGALRDAVGQVLSDPKKKPEPGATLTLTLPKPVALEALPEPIPLDIFHEDAHLIVVNKPAGMVVHPAAGTPSGTLVNALMHHCGASLSGIGGVQRPGIVHRIDKDTSGLLVVAKSDQAHQGLAAQFAAHDVDRRYAAVCWGVPQSSDPRLRGLAGVSSDPSGQVSINRPIARHRQDRKKMAVLPTGKHAITHLRTVTRLGDRHALINCQLETGRTHQIRVHLTYAGHPLFGDPVYGRSRSLPEALASDPRITGFQRQALHAQTLGFIHPVTAQSMAFQADIPADMADLITALKPAE